MTDNKWDDRKIEELLRNIPDIKDNRPRSEIAARLKQDDRLQDKHRNKRRNWVPAIAMIAALLILSILVPSMMHDREDSQMVISSDKENEEAEMDMASRSSMNQNESEMEDNSTAEEATNTYAFKGVPSVRFAVYPSDLQEGIVFHLGLAGDAAESVPVTFIVPPGQISEDFGNVVPDSYDLYKEYAGRIDEEALGFSAYHPYKGNIKKDGLTIIHTLPQAHGYDRASASFENYEHTLQDTFYGFKEVRFENEDGTIVEFDQVGEPSKPLQLNSGENFQNYYLFKQSNGMEFLTSNFGKSYETLEKALQDMKNKPNDIYSSLIPKDVNFEVIEEKDLTIVKFQNTLDLDAFSQTKAMQLIEGMLLTGASFGKQIQFENIQQTEWNGFDFSKKLPIPVGANPQPFLIR